MEKSLSDVTIHIDESLDRSQLELVTKSLEETEGVVSVIAHDDKPHLMVVKYDSDRTDSRAIHKAVTYLGYHAELLGL